MCPQLQRPSIDLAANQFGRKFGETSDLALRRSDFNLDILPLGITKITEGLAKWAHGFWATDEKHADARHLCRLLRARPKRPRRHRCAY